MIYKFILPAYIDLPISRRARSEKKLARVAAGKPYERYWLNMNVYRNLHRFIEHKLKEAFSPESGYPEFKAESITVSYIVERKGKRKYDTMNIISIVDKYFLDWLVNEGFLVDDDCETVSYGSMVGWNGCDQDRVIAIVKMVKPAVIQAGLGI